MTIVQVELPEKAAQELDALVKEGWFTTVEQSPGLMSFWVATAWL